MTRRSFISGGAALAVTASSVVGAPRAAERRLRMALVGTGARGSFTWGQDVVEGYSDVVEIVGLCDINRKRVEAAKNLIGTNAPSFTDFDRMRSEEHTSELQSRLHLVCRLLLEKKKTQSHLTSTPVLRHEAQD